MHVSLAYRAVGEGPPLLVLHGLFASHANWWALARQLADRRRVYCLDLRNHGRSPHAPTMTYAEMAADVHGFVTEHIGTAVEVAGHSMGGKVAMMLALTAPELVSRVISVDIAPVACRDRHRPYIRAMRALDLDTLASRADAEAALAADVPDAGERSFLLTNLVQDDGGWRWRLNLDAIAAAMPAILGFPQVPPGTAYAGPVHVLAGGASDYVRAEHQAPTHALFPAAAFEVLAGAGHAPHVQRPEATLAAFARCLPAVAAAGGG